MKRKYRSLQFVISILCLLIFPLGRLQSEEIKEKRSLKSGLSFEYFSRTINWDENKYTSKLKSYSLILNTEMKILGGFSFNLLLGYSSSQYAEMTFRKLPISLELDVGGIGGFLLGGEIKRKIIDIGYFEISAEGRFVTYLGGKKEWEIPELNVKGVATGKPRWTEGSVGPSFIYNGLIDFTPYLSLKINKLWGTFDLDEKIEKLSGREEKDIQGEGLFAFSLGTIYKFRDDFHLQGEASIFLPYKNGIDFGLAIKAIYTFGSSRR